MRLENFSTPQRAKEGRRALYFVPVVQEGLGGGGVVDGGTEMFPNKVVLALISRNSLSKMKEARAC